MRAHTRTHIPGYSLQLSRSWNRFGHNRNHAPLFRFTSLLVTDQITWCRLRRLFSLIIVWSPLAAETWPHTKRKSWICRLGPFHRRRSFAWLPWWLFCDCALKPPPGSLSFQLGFCSGKAFCRSLQTPFLLATWTLSSAFHKLRSPQLWLKLHKDAHLSGSYCYGMSSPLGNHVTYKVGCLPS